MTGISPHDVDREVDDNTNRKPLRTHTSVRDYLKGQTAGTEKTISQELNDYLPAEWDELEFGYSTDDIAHMKVTPETKQRIVSMTGTNISQGDVVTLFVLLGALNNGDLEEAQELASTVPELIWDLLTDLSANITTMGGDE